MNFDFTASRSGVPALLLFSATSALEEAAAAIARLELALAAMCCAPLSPIGAASIR
jgi:hypothetical protein